MIQLTSPSGTYSTLLSYRDNDNAAGGYFEWPFMSVMFWGEDPAGLWRLDVTSRSNLTNVEVVVFNATFYGVSTLPESVANIPATCHPNCSRGCSGEGSDNCDACSNLRNAYTLECIDTCPPGYTERNGYCYNSTLPNEECFSPLKEKEGGNECYNCSVSVGPIL